MVEACGYEPFLFTSRAELLAVVKGLECINQPAHVIVYTPIIRTFWMYWPS